MNRNIDEVEFTIFDTETTGLEPQSGDRIVEIAAVRLKGKDRLGEFQALVNPHRMVSPGAFGVNHITQEMLRDAPSIEAVMPNFLEFIQNPEITPRVNYSYQRSQSRCYEDHMARSFLLSPRGLAVGSH